MPLKIWDTYSCDMRSLVSGTINCWEESTISGTYYFVFGADEKPLKVTASGTSLTEGTLGSLVDEEWAYGDNDSLTFDTVYVKVPQGNPDSQAADFIKCTEPVTIFQAAEGIETGIRSIFISNYSETEDATINIVRTDENDIIKFKGIINLIQGQSPFSWSDLFNMAQNDKFKIHSSVEEVCVQLNGVEK